MGTMELRCTTTMQLPQLSARADRIGDSIPTACGSRSFLGGLAVGAQCCLGRRHVAGLPHMDWTSHMDWQMMTEQKGTWGVHLEG